MRRSRQRCDWSDPLRSFPLSLGIPPEGFGEFRVALAAADGALHQIDPPSQISESGGAGGSVDGGRNGAQHEHQMRCNNEAVIGEDQPPEGCQILES